MFTTRFFTAYYIRNWSFQFLLRAPSAYFHTQQRTHSNKCICFWHTHTHTFVAFTGCSLCSVLRLPFDEMGIDHGWSIKIFLFRFYCFTIDSLECEWERHFVNICTRTYIVRIFFSLGEGVEEWKMLEFILKTKGFVMTQSKVCKYVNMNDAFCHDTTHFQEH